MPIDPARFSRWSTETGARVWPWIAGGVFLVLLGGLYYLLISLQPKSVPQAEVIEGRGAMSAAERRTSDDIGEAERKYRRMLEAGAGSAEAVAVLDRAIEQQRQLLQANPRAGIEQSVRLERLTAARDTVRAVETAKKIAELEEGAGADRKADRSEAALAKLREAHTLQREVDNSSADARTKNFAHEMALLQAIETAQAEPLAREFEAAMRQAQAAVKAERWSEALAAFGRARDAQAKINQEFPRTRFTNLRVLNEIEAEIASLNAAGLAAEIEAREKGADAAADLGRAEEAAGFYKAAKDLQTTLNVQFARSRFVSTARIEELEIKRQTVLAAELLAAAAALDRGAAEALLKRQVVAATKKIHDATKLLATVEKDYPKTRNLDAALKLKLTYLDLHASDLRALQDKIYDRLVPLPDLKDLLLAKSETPQELYAKLMSGNPSRNAGMALPVDSVSWQDAQEFCRRASWVLGAQVRIPTEKEFRVALGDGERIGWSVENAGGHSQETMKQPASDAGYFDLIGNLGEWLQPEDPAAAKAPVAGGSYLDAAAELKKLPLVLVDKNERARHIGFRYVVEVALE